MITVSFFEGDCECNPYIYDPKEWATTTGPNKMEISEEDLERYRKYDKEKEYWNDRLYNEYKRQKQEKLEATWKR
jgi:hypothetical protein